MTAAEYIERFEHVAIGSAIPGKVLVVDADDLVAERIRDSLEMESHLVRVCRNGASAIHIARMWMPDVVILDLSLPDMDGHHVMRVFRREKIESAVLVLSARGSEADKVVGFRLGAEDYVVKPFGMLELMARVGVLVKRTQRQPPAPSLPLGLARRDVVRVADLVIDRDTRSVKRGTEWIELAPKEFDLLDALVRRGGAVARRNELLKEVWGYSSLVYSRTLDTHISQLRRKLEMNQRGPRLILTVHKTGYRMNTAE